MTNANNSDDDLTPPNGTRVVQPADLKLANIAVNTSTLAQLLVDVVRRLSTASPEHRQAALIDIRDTLADCGHALISGSLAVEEMRREEGRRKP